MLWKVTCWRAKGLGEEKREWGRNTEDENWRKKKIHRINKAINQDRYREQIIQFSSLSLVDISLQ